jgi:hypothetical protein
VTTPTPLPQDPFTVAIASALTAGIAAYIPEPVSETEPEREEVEA